MEGLEALAVAGLVELEAEAEMSLRSLWLSLPAPAQCQCLIPAASLPPSVPC